MTRYAVTLSHRRKSLGCLFPNCEDILVMRLAPTGGHHMLRYFQRYSSPSGQPLAVQMAHLRGRGNRDKRFIVDQPRSPRAGRSRGSLARGASGTEGMAFVRAQKQDGSTRKRPGSSRSLRGTHMQPQPSVVATMPLTRIAMKRG